jgi:hypothetical protein
MASSAAPHSNPPLLKSTPNKAELLREADRLLTSCCWASRCLAAINLPGAPVHRDFETRSGRVPGAGRPPGLHPPNIRPVRDASATMIKKGRPKGRIVHLRPQSWTGSTSTSRPPAGASLALIPSYAFHGVAHLSPPRAGRLIDRRVDFHPSGIASPSGSPHSRRSKWPRPLEPEHLSRNVLPLISLERWPSGLRQRIREDTYAGRPVSEVRILPSLPIQTPWLSQGLAGARPMRAFRYEAAMS